jgi:hypothetical protein
MPKYDAFIGLKIIKRLSVSNLKLLMNTRKIPMKLPFLFEFMLLDMNCLEPCGIVVG